MNKSHLFLSLLFVLFCFVYLFIFLNDTIGYIVSNHYTCNVSDIFLDRNSTCQNSDNTAQLFLQKSANIVP